VEEKNQAKFNTCECQESVDSRQSSVDSGQSAAGRNWSNLSRVTRHYSVDSHQ